MTITVTLPQPLNVLSPGSSISWVSDFIGPLPSDTDLVISILRNPGEVDDFYRRLIPTTTKTGSFDFFLGDGKASQFAQTWPTDGESVTVQLQLMQLPSSITDSGTVTTTWQSQPQIGRQVDAEISTLSSGTLTPTQATQLQQTQESTFPVHLIDDITLVELTSGPSPGPVSSFLPDTVFGVIVRITSVPPSMSPGTPDGDYWIPALAVVRVFRGSDLWKRWPIHTSSKLVSFLDESIVVGISAITVTQWLLNLSVQVFFAPGVEGRVFLMRFP